MLKREDLICHYDQIDFKPINFYLMMQEEFKKIAASHQVPQLLLHSCCAPCSSHVISVLHEYFDITVFYYNPNIEPYAEYEKRKEEEKRFLKEFPAMHKLELLDCDYDNDQFHQLVKGYEREPEGGARCFLCYEQRMDLTAKTAKEKGFDYFATTLTVSPYKNSAKLNEIGAKLEGKYQIPYLFSDFKKKNGYKHSIELSKEYGLYRQDYCGCVFSKAEVLKSRSQKLADQTKSC